MPSRLSSDSSATVPPRYSPEKTAALSERKAAGRPYVAAAAAKTATTSAALTVWKATEASSRREWSSKRLRISTLVPVASDQCVLSACQSSLGSAAAKRLNDERGRLCGCGVMSPWRERIRQIV